MIQSYKRQFSAPTGTYFFCLTFSSLSGVDPRDQPTYWWLTAPDTSTTPQSRRPELSNWKLNDQTTVFLWGQRHVPTIISPQQETYQPVRSPMDSDSNQSATRVRS